MPIEQTIQAFIFRTLRIAALFAFLFICIAVVFWDSSLPDALLMIWRMKWILLGVSAVLGVWHHFWS